MQMSLQTSQSTLALISTGPGFASARRREIGEEHRLARVAVIHERADALAFGARPLDRPGAPPFGQRPADLRGQARVARVLPVGVPVLVHPQPQAHGGGLAGHGGDALGEQLRLDVLGAHGCGMRGDRRERTGQAGDQGGERQDRSGHRGRISGDQRIERHSGVEFRPGGPIMLQASPFSIAFEAALRARLFYRARATPPCAVSDTVPDAVSGTTWRR